MMKTGIHPELHPVVFVDTSTGAEFVTTSTMTSDEKKKIDGVDHFVVRVEVSSASHPFYTGKQTLLDTAGRVDKFRARAEKAKKLQEQHAARKSKRDKKETVEERMTRKAKENAAKKQEEKAKKEESKKADKEKDSKK